MTKWLLLAGAILSEVTASLSLKGALDRPALYAVVLVGYAASFVALAMVLRRGMALGVAYGIWGALGVASDRGDVDPAVRRAVHRADGRRHRPGRRGRPGRRARSPGGGQRCRRGAGSPPLSWTLLVAAILSEVGATLSLKVAATGRPRWYAAVAAGYIAAFGMLSLALNEGMALGVAYGIWAAAGVALTASPVEATVRRTPHADDAGWHRADRPRRAGHRARGESLTISATADDRHSEMSARRSSYGDRGPPRRENCST